MAGDDLGSLNPKRKSTEREDHAIAKKCGMPIKGDYGGATCFSRGHEDQHQGGDGGSLQPGTSWTGAALGRPSFAKDTTNATGIARPTMKEIYRRPGQRRPYPEDPASVGERRKERSVRMKLGIKRGDFQSYYASVEIYRKCWGRK